MERAEFLKTLGTGTLAVCSVCGLISCSDDDNPTPIVGGDLDFTINIEESPYTNLKIVGGSTYKDKIIIARTGNDTFVALSKVCTHAGQTVVYDHPNSRFVCNAHNSIFETSGTVVSGPANRALTKFKTEFNAPNLRIFS